MYSLTEAYADLVKCVDENAIRKVVAKVSADAAGSVTMLYSGGNSGLMRDAAVNADPNLRVIGKTDTAELLKSRQLKQALARIHNLDLDVIEDILAKQHSNPINQFVEGIDGLWSDVSVRFA
jgi:hypothetical protein